MKKQLCVVSAIGLSSLGPLSRVSGQVLVRSDFNADAEGWTAIGDPASYVPQWLPDPGTGPVPGLIRVVDAPVGATVFAAAPPAFLLALAGAEGGTFEFDIRLEGSPTGNPTQNVVLIGNNAILCWDNPDNPTTDWTHWSVPLIASEWKVCGTPVSPPPEEFSAILRAASGLWINCEFVNGTEKTRLDTITLSAQDPGACFTIRRQPLDARVSAGGSAIFAVVAELAGTAPGYQWRRNGVNLVNSARVLGADTPVLVITNASAADAGTIDCVLSSSCGSRSSAPASLSVACYANCDESTTPPILNIADFLCFQSRFAAGCP
jgi:hypothetical protein